ncbi:MAG: ArsR family transcriptional regulator [Archaeoglobi archaeon]|nr:ArsR family transcriptional regulator [Candidatus Mnemosynella sp.]
MNMDELLGYITGNPKREKIVETLSSGALKFQEISKITRIPEGILRRIMSEMVEHGIVREEGEVFRLTEEAEKALARLRGL